MHAATFGALGEPSRLRIVELLRSGPSSVGEIAEALGIRQPRPHLRGSARRGSSPGRRWRRRIYQLEAAPFEQIGTVESFEQTWEARLDSLGRYPAEAERRRAEGDPDDGRSTTDG